MAVVGQDIQRAAECLKNGELVAIPTETVYGLAANALNPEACVQIFEAKNRPFFDPLIVHIKSIDEVTKFVRTFPEVARKLCETLWPGPLTIVLPKSELIPDLVTAGQETVALRVPRHPMTLELLNKLDFPLAAPSANPFGYVSPTKAEHVAEQLGDRVSYILDGGNCEVGLESTIVRFGEKIELLRLGGLEPDVLKNLVGDFTERIHQHSNPDAPGQMDKHYATATKLVLAGSLDEAAESLKHNSAFLGFDSMIAGIEERHQFLLAPDADTTTAAKNLFEMLRKIDRMGYGQIVAVKLPETGLGRAVNDRLTRASAAFNQQ